jgi:hypothetical protein
VLLIYIKYPLLLSIFLQNRKHATYYMQSQSIRTHKILHCHENCQSCQSTFPRLIYHHSSAIWNEDTSHASTRSMVLFFDISTVEDETIMLPWKVRDQLTSNAVSYPRRINTSTSGYLKNLTKVIWWSQDRTPDSHSEGSVLHPLTHLSTFYLITYWTFHLYHR